jgi:hypothetical protein
LVIFVTDKPTDQHRATPEDWGLAKSEAEDGSHTDSCLLELCARVEALDAAQLEQAESNRFCTDAIVRRVEALEAFDHRPLLAAVRAQSKAVAHFGNRLDALEAAQQDKLDRLIALDRDDPTPDADMTDYERVAANMASCPSIDRIPDFTGAAPAMTELRAASAEAQPAGLVERVRQIIGLDPVGDGKARAAICEVAAWLREQGTPASGWAMRLEQEADRG